MKNVKKKQIAVLTQVQILRGDCSCRGGSNGDGRREKKEQRKGQIIRSRRASTGKKKKKATSLCYMMPFKNISKNIYTLEKRILFFI